MLDYQLFKLIISTVQSQLIFAAIPGVTLDQAYQPIRQGVSKLPSAYMYKLYDIRDGYPQEEYIWDELNEVETKTMTQVMRSSFQITALNIPQPANNTQYTASDIANLLAAILQTDVTIATLNAQGVGILNITEIRNPFFLDDRDRWEASPSFDFTLAHKQILTGTTPIIEDVTFNTLAI